MDLVATEPATSGVGERAVDEGRGLLKINPLADWSRADVERFVADNYVPYNVLHDRGFPSIGCAPCTRAVRVGESERIAVAGAKAGVRIVLPLGLCFLPAFVLLTVVPLVMGLVEPLG